VVEITAKVILEGSMHPQIMAVGGRSR
jgi:hypothetical protein